MRKAGFALILFASLLVSTLPSNGLRAADAAPAGPYLQPNQKASIGGWEIQVSNGIQWTKEIKGSTQASSQGSSQGNAKSNKAATATSKNAQNGMTFALVPVTIKNTSTKTSGLLVGVWNFYDYTGKSYLMLTLGIDFLPVEDQLNMKDFKPGESRKGYLPFELPDGIDKKDKYMQLIIPLVGSATWKL